MTWKAVREVIDMDGVKPTAKLVLLVLAVRANTEGQAWPSVGRLSADTGLSESSVQRALRSLAEDGFITIEERPGRASVLTVRGVIETPLGVSERREGVSERHPGVSERHPEVVKERDRKKTAGPGSSTTWPSPAQNGNGNGNGNGSIAARTAAVDARRKAAAACPACDDEGVVLGEDAWCKH